MKNKFYNIFFASEDNDFRRSIRLSKRILYIIVFFGIIFCFLCIMSTYRILNYDSLNYKLNEAKFEIFHLKEKIKIDSLLISYPSFAAPVDGFVTKGINYSDDHNGIDIASVKGNIVRAVLDGIVVFSGYDSVMGNIIILSHNNNFFSLYGHNDTNLVRVRDFVRINSPIARIGNSGSSDGPHLHFEIWDGVEILDPRDLIQKYKENDVSIK